MLGWAGGASDARHELDRLTRLEAGRQLKATCDAAARDRLETAAEILRAQVRDSQAAIELFTATQAKNMIRITAPEGENVELRKPVLALLELQPLVEPVYIGKALMAHREARGTLRRHWAGGGSPPGQYRPDRMGLHSGNGRSLSKRLE